MTTLDYGTNEKLFRFGGSGGEDFDIVATSPHITISGRHGKWVTQLGLNEDGHGSGEGTAKPESLLVSQKDYINYAKISWWNFGLNQYVTEIEFRTKLGLTWRLESSEEPSRTKEPFETVELKNIRVLGIGGSAGNVLDAVTLRYLEDYNVGEGLNTVNAPKDLKAILKVYGEGSQVSITETQRQRELEALLSVNQFTISVENEITGTYMLAEATARFGFEYMNRTELNQEIEKERSTSTVEKHTVSGNKVGLVVCNVEVMELIDPNDEAKTSYFLVPTTGESFQSVDKNSLDAMNFIDLSTNIKVQFSEIKTQEKWGFDYYHAAAE